MAAKYDVVIVGAGPAGMFAARELIRAKLKVVVIDRGRDVAERHCEMEYAGICQTCDPCNILCGVGGAGTFSDGTLNLRPDVGGNLRDYTKDDAQAWNLVHKVDKTFLEYGVRNELAGSGEEDVRELKKRAASVGVNFVEIRQRHIGSDFTQKVISDFKQDLDRAGVEFRLETRVHDVWLRNGECCGAILENGKRVSARNVLLAPGRVGSSWMNELVKRHKIEARYAPIDIGVRVEVPSIVMDWVTGINRDPKFHIRTSHHDDFVRTFCTNRNGFVVKERYDDIIGVNGHAFRDKNSENTNFALLVTIDLTEPLENTTIYGEYVGRLAYTLGGGKPILQRMGDLRRGRRSTPERIARNMIQNTLRDITPGDIAMALPHRIVMDLVESLETLDKIIPGVASDSTLLYAPEIKFYSMKVKVNRQLESSIPHLFVAGDGTGLSRDIVNASATGILAGRGIIHEYKRK
ncbi:MAG: NAD(P)/FAD-dependent oxidoreductase [Candidatus Abyssobacteria bacterium SURF_17]|uniref:NAD(P)/FAD-dependent oxidoreductase n=1 Tax=Candidatus Abyssobacteria bacterium SURF_17 TaxID=2093361 RepID=A0A419F0N3_9BACT|nr:MAG: NAD(P)/FAD-dependent oxidoreductase [Candidatus Abyssubacteria bacterium SURF_17]